MPNLDQATKLSSGDMQNSDVASDAAYTLQWKGCTLQSLSSMETGGGEVVRVRSLGKKIKDSGYAHRSQDKRITRQQYFQFSWLLRPTYNVL